MGVQWIIVNIFQLSTAGAMSSYKDQFAKIGVVLHTLYFENEGGDPQFFAFLTKGTHQLTVTKVWIKSVIEVFHANVLKQQLWLKFVLLFFVIFILLKLIHILCYCTASKILLILVTSGIKIPYYPMVLSRRLKLLSDNVNWNSCIRPWLPQAQ